MCGPERPPGTRSISTAIRATRYSARSGSTAISGSGARCTPESRPSLRSAKPHRRTRRELAADPTDSGPRSGLRLPRRTSRSLRRIRFTPSRRSSTIARGRRHAAHRHPRRPVSGQPGVGAVLRRSHADMVVMRPSALPRSEDVPPGYGLVSRDGNGPGSGASRRFSRRVRTSRIRRAARGEAVAAPGARSSRAPRLRLGRDRAPRGRPARLRPRRRQPRESEGGGGEERLDRLRYVPARAQVRR